MRTKLLAIAICLTAAECWAAGVWNGTTTTLSATQSAAAPDYPVLMAALVQPDGLTADQTVISIDDNGSGADGLSLVIAGTDLGDPVRANATDNGTTSTAAAATGASDSRYQLVVAYFKSASSRRALRSIVGTSQITWGTEDTSTRNVGNLTHIRIGGGGPTALMDGNIAHAAIWYGVDDDLVDVAVRQLSSGLRPQSNRSIIRDALVHCQPLVSEANENKPHYGDVFVGSTMTAANLTFDNMYANLKSGRHLMNFTSPDSTKNYRWPIAPPTVGPLPDHRMVKFEGGFLALAGSGDANAIGATKLPYGPYNLPGEYATFYVSGYQLVRRHIDGPLEVEVAGGDEIESGEVVYQGDDGCAASTGTIRIGVARVGGEGGDVITVLPSWGD